MRRLALAALCAVPMFAPQAQQPVKIRSIADSVVTLSNGQRWQPGLYRIRHIYTLYGSSGTPFFVLLGVGCLECDALYEIDILRAGQLADSRSASSLATPGRETEMGDDSADAFRRQFFGRCLGSTVDAAVQFAHEEVGDTIWVDSIRTVTSVGDSVLVLNYRRTDSLEHQVLARVRAGTCHEWPHR